jgi:signal transduction histidine kinase
MRIPEAHRGVVADVLLGLGAATAVGVAVLADVAGPVARPPAATAAGLGFAVALGAALLVRRRFPVPVLLGTAAGLLAYYVLDLPAVGLAVPAAAALYSAAEAGHLRWAAATAAALVLVATVARVHEGDDPGFLFGIELASTVLTMVAVVVLGDGVRSRRLLRAAQARWAEQVAADREREAARRVQQERLRIARDLHDVLAHSVAVVSVQAAVAAEAIRDDPESAERALAAVRAAGSAVLADLRGTLGLLRDGDDPQDRHPVGGVAQLAQLARSTGAAGVPVELQVEGEPVPLPAAVDATVYRIAQEALTNVLRHAAAGRVDVLLRYGRDLRLTVVDDGQGGSAELPAGRGMGLRGMRERAELLGGSLAAGRDRAGGFRVDAVLPLGHR